MCRKLAGNGEKASFVEEGVWSSGASLPRAAAFITEHIFGARVNISYRVSSKHIKAGVPWYAVPCLLCKSNVKKQWWRRRRKRRGLCHPESYLFSIFFLFFLQRLGMLAPAIITFLLSRLAEWLLQRRGPRGPSVPWNFCKWRGFQSLPETKRDGVNHRGQ